MRRQHFIWTYLVLAIVLTAYGGYSLIYNQHHQKAMSILGLVFFIIGTAMLALFLILFLISLCQKKKANLTEARPMPEEKKDEPFEKIKEEAEPVAEEKPSPSVSYAPREDVTYVRVQRNSVRSFEGGSGYVRRAGYGPLLRINDEEILDMRSNTYYRIEGNMVKQSGMGPVFEISGNRIRAAFGGYLYEISGSNVNKVFGGYYASIGGGILQTHDLQDRFEIPSDLNLKQKLAVVALLFGTY